MKAGELAVINATDADVAAVYSGSVIDGCWVVLGSKALAWLENGTLTMVLASVQSRGGSTYTFIVAANDLVAGWVLERRLSKL